MNFGTIDQSPALMQLRSQSKQSKAEDEFLCRKFSFRLDCIIHALTCMKWIKNYQTRLKIDLIDLKMKVWSRSFLSRHKYLFSWLCSTSERVVILLWITNYLKSIFFKNSMFWKWTFKEFSIFTPIASNLSKWFSFFNIDFN